MKVGMALGIGGSGVVLEATGFNAELGVQSEHTLTLIRFFLSAIPVAGLLVALVALSFLDLTPQKMADIRRQLEERRGQV